MLIELLTKQYPGMRIWLTQRITAAYLAVYLLLLLLMLFLQQPSDYQTWYAFFVPIWWRILSMLFVLCLIVHAWLGVSHVLKDYIVSDRLRAVLQLMAELVLLFDLIWLVMIFWQL